MAHIAIVSPGYPSGTGGVTDHTARLERHWTGTETVSVLGTLERTPGEVVAGWQREGVSAVLIQYVPFLYGRRGLSRSPRQIAELSRSRQMRVTVFVHEPWVPPTRLPWLVLSPLQRRQLLGLAAQADAVVCPVPAWARQLGSATQLLYVGSTLGEPPTYIEPQGELPFPVVFSPFAAGLAWDWISAAAEEIGTGLTVLGCDRESALAHKDVNRRMMPDWDYRGRLPAGVALDFLSQARLVLAPFIDGLTGRRTSTMAALSVGARVLSSRGPLFDPMFDDSPVACADSRDDFVRQAAAMWRERKGGAGDRASRIAWYREQLDPRMLDARLIEIVTASPAA